MAKVIRFILGGYYKVVPIAVVYFAASMAMFVIDPFNTTGVFYIGVGLLALTMTSLAFTVLFVRKK
jgi:hypothetical protein